MENIIIDMTVSDYSDAAACNEQSLIHQTQMKQFKSIIKRQIENIKEFNLEHRRTLHDTISIFGNRGAGKTTFLLTALDQIEKDYAHDSIVLKPLDPSLIECKQHPFINILAAIHEKVEQYQYDNPRKKQDYREDLEQYNNAYKKVLKGLPYIDGVGSDNLYKDWDDELFVSVQGIEKAEASNNLEINFHNYINRTLRLLNKKFIVISFDDIDTHFTKGFEILEVIRKYLTSDQIITILTGDLELYSKLVRKASWSCFDTDYLKKECEFGDKDKHDFSSMVNHIENQYLLKLLKPENRIQLLTIGQVTEEYGTTIKIKFNEEKPLDLISCYGVLTSKLRFSKDSEDLYNFFIGLSLRAQLRLFKLIQRIKTDNDFSQDRARIVQSFVSIFSNDINQKASNARALVCKDKHYIVEMQKFLINSGVLHECCDFMPHTSDETFNKAMLAIAVNFNLQVPKHPFMIFDFWIRICYLNYITKDLEFNHLNNSIKDFIKFTSIDGKNNLTQCVGRSEAYYQGIRKNNSFSEKASIFPGTFIIKDILYNSEDYKLAMLVLHTTIDDNKQEKHFASLFKLLSVIRDLLYIYTQDQKKGDNQFYRLSQLRSYLEPSINNPSTYKEKFADDDRNGATTFSKDTSLYTSIQKEFFNWANKLNDTKGKVKTESYLNPQLLNRIFTRMYFTLLNINKDTQYTNLGDRMNAYIVAFLNSSLVEEALLYGNKNIVVENTNNLIEKFKYNLQNTNNITSCQLTYWLFQCPLIQIFLNPYLLYAIDFTINYKNEPQGNVLWEKYKYDKLRRKENSLLHDVDSCIRIQSQLLKGKNWITKSMRGLDHHPTEEENLSFDPKTPNIQIIDMSPFEDSIYVLQPLYDRYTSMEKREELISKIKEYSVKQINLQTEITQIQSNINGIASFIKENMNLKDDGIKNKISILDNHEEAVLSFFNYLCTIRTI